MISIVTGTLDRKHFLPELIKNTVDSSDKVELVLVDGGSKDGTIEFIKDLNPKILILFNNVSILDSLAIGPDGVLYNLSAFIGTSLSPCSSP